MKLKNFLQFNENMHMDDDMMHHDREHTNYMFFENLKTIKRLVDELLEMDEVEIDEIIDSGHDWAADHIAVAKVDVEQVFNFLTNNTQEDMNDDDDDFDDMTGNMPDMNPMMGNMSDEDDMEDVEDYSSDEDDMEDDEDYSSDEDDMEDDEDYDDEE